MIHTNHGELIRIFDTYCRVWGAGGQATLTTSTKGGLLTANLDIQLGPPTAACPIAVTAVINLVEGGRREEEVCL